MLEAPGGYHTLEAEDRAKALAPLDVQHADPVVVDVNGETLGLLDAVRSASWLASRIDPNTPLIVLTGRADAVHQIRLLERGGDDVVTSRRLSRLAGADCRCAPADPAAACIQNPPNRPANDRH